MRILAYLVLALSLCCAIPTLAAEQISFEKDPIVTLELDESLSPYSFYFYGAAGVIAFYALAAFKIGYVQRLNLSIWSFLVANSQTRRL
jgi:hypothetical protein